MSKPEKRESFTVGARLYRDTDSDIIEFLARMNAGGQSNQDIITTALRLLAKNEPATPDQLTADLQQLVSELRRTIENIKHARIEAPQPDQGGAGQGDSGLPPAMMESLRLRAASGKRGE